MGQSSEATERPPLAGDGCRPYVIHDISFRSHDGTDLFGKLTTPESEGPHPVAIWVQTAEAQNVDLRVQIGGGQVIEYFDLFRDGLARRNIAFFSYEGRGVRTGENPPRFVEIDRTIFNTGTLENKVQDALAAVQALQHVEDIDASRMVLIGASEGTLLAAEAATRLPEAIRGLALHGVLTDLREALTWIVTEGAFMQHCAVWDTDKDGRITRAEFEADPKGYRRLMPGVEFDVFDSDGDGVYTLADRMSLAAPIIEAIHTGNVEIVNEVLRSIAAVDLPDGWAEDHFSHRPTWEFVSQLEMPIAIFHGGRDLSTPVEGARRLERQAAAAGKTNIRFHYYPELDHNLGGLEYWQTGVPPEPFRATFDFLADLVRPPSA